MNHIKIESLTHPKDVNIKKHRKRKMFLVIMAIIFAIGFRFEYYIGGINHNVRLANITTAIYIILGILLELTNLIK
jgi:hypothetical protein